ncbi:hypothetical protein L7F22_019985 [Adiantum nelumboides]|nr:hypothetical protein [Adiantum nelumboides]
MQSKKEEEHMQKPPPRSPEKKPETDQSHQDATRSLVIACKEDAEANKEDSTKAAVAEFIENPDIFYKEFVLIYENDYGANIYQDDNGNYYYRVGEVATLAPERVLVYYNADCYIDRAGAQYHGTEDPDAILVEQTPNSSSPLQAVQAPEDQDKVKAEASTQRSPVQEEGHQKFEETMSKSNAECQAETCSQSSKKVNFMLDADNKVKLNFTAEIDQEATTNVMAYGMWLLLNKPLMYEIQVKVSISPGIEVISLGIVEASLKLQSKAVTDKFLVVDSRQMSMYVILSKQWVDFFEDEAESAATITIVSSKANIKEKLEVKSPPSVVDKGKAKAEQGPTWTIKKTPTRQSKSLAKPV